MTLFDEGTITYNVSIKKLACLGGSLVLAGTCLVRAA